MEENFDFDTFLAEYKELQQQRNTIKEDIHHVIQRLKEECGGHVCNINDPYLDQLYVRKQEIVDRIDAVRIILTQKETEKDLERFLFVLDTPYKIQPTGGMNGFGEYIMIIPTEYGKLHLTHEDLNEIEKVRTSFIEKEDRIMDKM